MSRDVLTGVQGAAASRLVARAVTELMMARARAWETWLAIQGRIDYVLLQAVLGNDGFEREAPHAISSFAIAESMGLPYETVRRRARALARDGILVTAEGGWRASRERVAEWREAGLLRDDAAALLATIGSLAESGHEAARRAIAAGAARVPEEVLAQWLLTCSLRLTTSFTQLYGDLVSGTVVGTIVAANVRHLTLDPQLARRWAGEDDIPPDSERRPVSVRTLARELKLPYETTRRHVAALKPRDMVEEAGGGVIVPSRVLDRPQMRAFNLQLVARFEQMLAKIEAEARRA